MLKSIIIRGYSVESMVAEVTTVLGDLADWCISAGIEITFASVIPCPANQDVTKCKDKALRTTHSAIFMRINDWIRAKNEGLESGQLPLARFVSHNKRSRGNRISRRNVQNATDCKEEHRCYPGTIQDRIVLGRFSENDWIHLSPSGLRVVEGAIHKFCEAC